MRSDRLPSILDPDPRLLARAWLDGCVAGLFLGGLVAGVLALIVALLVRP